MPTTRTSVGGRSMRAGRPANCESTALRTLRGPRATFLDTEASASTRPDRSHTVARKPVAPTSATSRGAPLRREAGALPRDGAGGGAVVCGAEQPGMQNTSRGWLTVLRAEPVVATSSVRDRLGAARNSPLLSAYSSSQRPSSRGTRIDHNDQAATGGTHSIAGHTRRTGRVEDVRQCSGARRQDVDHAGRALHRRSACDGNHR
jgi:hypothetical protein